MIKVLLENNYEDVQLKESLLKTNDYRIIDFFVDRGFDIKSNIQFFFENAVHKNNLELCKYLEKFMEKFDIDIDKLFEKKIKNIYTCDKTEILQYLIDKGVNIKNKPLYLLLSIRHCFFESIGRFECLNLFELLVENGINIKYRWNDSELKMRSYEKEFKIANFILDCDQVACDEWIKKNKGKFSNPNLYDQCVKKMIDIIKKYSDNNDNSNQN
jgi:hypothetical protein